MKPVRLAAGDPAGDRLTGRVTLDLDGEPTDFEITVPAGPNSVDDLMPVFQGLTDVVVESATRRVESEGKTISCRAGCGACCRQLVPVSEAEARHLARLVEAMPEPRRSEVRQRFEAALEALATGGLIGRVEDASARGVADAVALGLEYFRRGVACPFLEAESCSIHPDRPLSCREYLVTSPSANCADPTPKTIARAPLTRISLGVAAASRSATHGGWVALVTALQFAAASPPPVPDRLAPDLIRQVLDGGRSGRTPFRNPPGIC